MREVLTDYPVPVLTCPANIFKVYLFVEDIVLSETGELGWVGCEALDTSDGYFWLSGSVPLGAESSHCFPDRLTILSSGLKIEINMTEQTIN